MGMFGTNGVVGMCLAYGFLGGVPLEFLACRATRGLSHLIRASLLCCPIVEELDDDFGTWMRMLGASDVVGMCSAYGFYGEFPWVFLLAEMSEAYLI